MKGRSRGISGTLKANWHELATEERDGSGIKPDAVVGEARIRTSCGALPLCFNQKPDLSRSTYSIILACVIVILYHEGNEL